LLIYKTNAFIFAKDTPDTIHRFVVDLELEFELALWLALGFMSARSHN